MHKKCINTKNIHYFIHLYILLYIYKTYQYPQIYTIFPTSYHIPSDCSANLPILPHPAHLLIITNNIIISNNTNYIPIYTQYTNAANYTPNCNIIQASLASLASPCLFPKLSIAHYTTIYSA